MLRKIGLLALFLALTLLVSGAAHATPLAGSTRASESGIVDRFWDWFESLFQGGHSASKGTPNVVWDLDSSHIDPNGDH